MLPFKHESILAAYETLLADVGEIVRRELQAAQPEQKVERVDDKVDLSVYISLKDAAEQLGVSTKTISAHKKDFQFRNRFGKIYIVRQSLIDYIESSKPLVRQKQIMYTRKKAA